MGKLHKDIAMFMVKCIEEESITEQKIIKVMTNEKRGSNIIKVTRSAIMNIFRKKSFLFKSFVIIELSYNFTINLFTTAENCMEK